MPGPKAALHPRSTVVMRSCMARDTEGTMSTSQRYLDSVFNECLYFAKLLQIPGVVECLSEGGEVEATLLPGSDERRLLVRVLTSGAPGQWMRGGLLEVPHNSPFIAKEVYALILDC